MAINSAASGSIILANPTPPALANAPKFTLALWLLQNAWAGSKGIWGVGNGVELLQFGATDQLDFFFATGSQTGQTPVGAVPVGSWHHVCYVCNLGGGGNLARGNLNCYIDGVEVSLIYAGTCPATIGSASTSFRICQSPTFPNPANHAQAHLRGWAAALDIREVQQEMASYWAVRQANLLWDIPEDDGIPVHTPSTGVIPVDYSQHITGVPTVTDTLTQVSGPPSVTRRVPVLAA